MPPEHPSTNAKQTWIFKSEEARTGEIHLGLMSMVLKDMALNKIPQKVKIKRSQRLRHGALRHFEKEKNTEQEKPQNQGKNKQQMTQNKMKKMLSESVQVVLRGQ